MKTFDVQGIELEVGWKVAFTFIADPGKLPMWTSAFASAGDGKAVMRTPCGEVTVDLDVSASLEFGAVDWRMTFPDRTVASAFSRVVEIARERCVFTFVLPPPPVALEILEGTLEAQSRTLREELMRLKQVLESRERAS